MIVSKIKLLVAGIGLTDHDLAPLELGGGIANGSSRTLKAFGIAGGVHVIQDIVW